MKKRLIFISLLSILATTSCKDITSINVDTKRPTAIPANMLFTSAEKSLVDVITSANVNTNIFRMLAQQWTETTYTDEANYDLASRNIPQSLWHIIYRDVLKDLNTANTILTADASLPAGVKKNQQAMIEILNVYAYSILVNTFGNIPYSKALDFENPTMVYDDAKTVSLDLIKRLDAAVANLNAESGFGGSDLLFSSNVSKWTKFANSLKLRLGMILADVDPANAKTAIESAAKGVITNTEDNASFAYLSTPPNVNPLWTDFVQSGRKDFVAANTLVDAMNALTDPRVSKYFTTDSKGGYSGGIYGASNNYASFSKVNTSLTGANTPSILIDYMEVEFLLAEAVERGYAVSGTAAKHYENAINASLTAWGVSSADAATYLASTSVAYATAKGNWKQKIGTQKWIALYNRGFEAWTEVRRLDFPALVAPSTARSAFPVRFTYPVSEQNLNKENYSTAAAAVGGDKVDTKLFWDKF